MWGGCQPGGCLPRRGVVSAWGGCLPGWYLSGGCLAQVHAGIHPPWTEWQTGVKHYLAATTLRTVINTHHHSSSWWILEHRHIHNTDDQANRWHYLRSDTTKTAIHPPSTRQVSQQSLGVTLSLQFDLFLPNLWVRGSSFVHAYMGTKQRLCEQPKVFMLKDLSHRLLRYRHNAVLVYWIQNEAKIQK